MKAAIWNRLPQWARTRVIAVLNQTAPDRTRCPHCPPAIQATCLCSWLAYRAGRKGKAESLR